jgi:hypothetical protein
VVHQQHADADALARRYRRWLLAYPAEYRRARGDELVATLLDLAEPDRTHPAAPEVFAMLRSAAEQRLRHLLARWRAPWSSDRRSRTILVLGFVWACIISVSVFLAPMTLGYSCVDQTIGGGILVDCRPQAGFLLARDGLWGYLWLVPPWELAMLAALVRRRWMPLTAATLMTVFVVATVNTLGTYYLPSLLACWLGAVWATNPGMPAAVGAAGIPGEPSRP